MGGPLCLFFASTVYPSREEEEGTQSLGAELSLTVEKVSPCCFIPCSVLVGMLLFLRVWGGGDV